MKKHSRAIRSNALSPALRQDALALRCGANEDAAGIVGVGFAPHEAVLFETVDQPGHRREGTGVGGV